jgi:hypothetical protein
MATTDRKSKFNPKKNVPWNEYDPQNMVFDKVETKTIPGEGKGDYNNLCFNYGYSEDEVGELRIKWADLENCWISPFYDKEKDRTTWSITHYFDLGVNKDFDEFIEKLSYGHLGLIEENKDKLDANTDLAEKNFDPTDMKAISDLWGGFIGKVKGAPKGSKKRKLKWKGNKGGKPDTRRFLSEKEAEEEVKKLVATGMKKEEAVKKASKKTKPIDADYVAQKKCRLRIISRNPQIYCARTVNPQNIVYSCIILDLDESGVAPDDLFDDEVEDLFIGGVDTVKKGANKLSALESAGKPVIDAKKPAAAEGSKDKEKGGETKALTGLAARVAEKTIKAKEAAKKGAEKTEEKKKAPGGKSDDSD